uniref:NADH-ubiquinone oxidoreductase chain 3 n=1 Tax=Thermobia domestica TaxID=89055 RepID=Q6DVL3_THEDO|nr:NADH dehydrogenase subunit 3 [Thermobia domestica]AAT69286.1 NADH dehydrogenase subunit 3 [Thermobia domestica]
MNTVLTTGLLTIIICLIVMTISTLLSKKVINDREKNSPFECGFDPKSSARIPFSLRFFLIAVIFLIFDVEIALLLPMTITINNTNTLSWSLVSLVFLVILLMGLYHEWNQGSLTWAD